MRLTHEQETQIRARLAAATPGPWEASAHKAHPTTGDWDYFEEEHGVYPPMGQRGPVALAPGAANAALIAHAPADIAALLAELDALRTDYTRRGAFLSFVKDREAKAQVAREDAERARDRYRRLLGGAYVRFPMPTDEPVQYVGVHPVKWGRTDEPTAGFREIDVDALLTSQEVQP